jgi:hypothetical protein
MMLPSLSEILIVVVGFALPATYIIIAHLIVKSGEKNENRPTH